MAADALSIGERERESEQNRLISRARESQRQSAKENLMVPRNKTKLAHCLIICVSGRRRRQRLSPRRICPLAILRCSISIQVFIFIIIFLYFSRCLSYSCYYYLLAIIDTMYILLLFVSMWLVAATAAATATISHRSHR